MAKNDNPTRDEVIQRNNQPTARIPGAGTTTAPRADGINKLIPATNNTRAPGQYGKS